MSKLIQSQKDNMSEGWNCFKEKEDKPSLLRRNLFYSGYIYALEKDPEIQSLREQLKESNRRRDIAEECVDFYADNKADSADWSPVFFEEKGERFRQSRRGKRAREAVALRDEE